MLNRFPAMLITMECFAFVSGIVTFFLGSMFADSPSLQRHMSAAYRQLGFSFWVLLACAAYFFISKKQPPAQRALALAAGFTLTVWLGPLATIRAWSSATKEYREAGKKADEKEAADKIVADAERKKLLEGAAAAGRRLSVEELQTLVDNFIEKKEPGQAEKEDFKKALTSHVIDPDAFLAFSRSFPSGKSRGPLTMMFWDPEMIEALYQAGARPNMTDEALGRNPLCEYYSHRAMFVHKEKGLELVRVWLKHGEDPRLADRNGRTAENFLEEKISGLEKNILEKKDNQCWSKDLGEDLALARRHLELLLHGRAKP